MLLGTFTNIHFYKINDDGNLLLICENIAFKIKTDCFVWGKKEGLKHFASGKYLNYSETRSTATFVLTESGMPRVSSNFSIDFEGENKMFLILFSSHL